MKLAIIITLIIGVTVIMLLQTDLSAVPNLDRDYMKVQTPLAQIEKQKAQIRTQPIQMSIVEMVSSTWEFLFGGQNRTPDTALPSVPVDLSYFSNPKKNKLNITWMGHSSLMINIDGYRILTDPVFEKRISIIGPTRFNGNVPLKIDAIPAIDAVVISHDHYDHLNKKSVQHLHPKTSKFIVPIGVGDLIAKWGVSRHKIVELGWWQEFYFDKHLMFAATPAQHFSGRGLTDRNKTLWASWVIKTPSHRLYFSGDSGYFEGFRQIGETYGPFDMTFIECGAYNQAWTQVHMFPEETVQAHMDLKGKVLHPIHWGTFNLAMHPWYEPMERLLAAAKAGQTEIAIPMVGETTRYGAYLPVAKWWQEAMVHSNANKTAGKENS